MVRRMSLALVVLGFAAALSADVVTKKFDWNPVNGAQDVNVEVNRVAVSQIDFDMGSTLEKTPIRRSSAKAVARVDNNGWLDVEVGIAVVVFDEEGNVVAAGSGGTKWGYLNKGERDRYTIFLPYVYRRFDKAKTLLITLETKEKPARRGKAAPKPTPAQ
jgi:hypothetical protein